jgi:phosphatidylglycerophosphate synthase
MEPVEPINRRELATRRRAWPPVLARALARGGVTPNQVSVASILFALLGGLFFWMANWNAGGGPRLWLVLAAIAIQLRLLCNMIDGLLAIECRLKTPTGDLFNELPDRVADILLLVGAGYSIQRMPWGITLGWVAAMLAVLTAYVRVFGGSLGLTQDFQGPMAKQHRMFTLTVGALAGAVEYTVHQTVWSVSLALSLIVIGSTTTLMRRIGQIASTLEAR